MASTIKVNSISAQSGVDVNIPTGFKLKVADAGELYIGDTKITAGATQVTSRSANTTIGVGSGDVDLTGKSMSVLSVDASSGASATITVTLPLASTFGTTAIQVVSAAAHGAGNKIEIKKHATDGGTEVFTLYHLADHCELVSDGTSVLRTGNEWTTIRGEVALTANYATAASTAVDLFDAVGANYTEVTDIGGCWSTTTDDFTAPHDGLYMLGGSLIGVAYCYGYGFKKNGTFIQAIDGVGIMYSNSMFGLKPHVLAKNDVITWWESENAATTNSLDGNASAAMPRCTGDWWCLRRF
jgi:hypothetical protein